MKHLSKILWLIPVGTHIGYFLATYNQLPQYIGGSDRTTGTSLVFFVIEWFSLMAFANIAFSFIHLRLPFFNDKTLKVPRQEYWLANDTNRGILVDRLRGVCEVTLLTINILFLAVYQDIYETNALEPILKIKQSVLIVFFMIIPILILIIMFAATMRSLSVTTKKNHVNHIDGHE